jgi:hypothetical protein
MVSRRLDMYSNILIIRSRKEHASSSEAVLKNSCEAIQGLEVSKALDTTDDLQTL